MYIICTIAIVGLLLCGFAQLRNCVVYNVRTEHSRRVHKKHLQLIKEDRYSEIDYEEYDGVAGWDGDMLNLTKWTYEDFYGKKP